MPVPSNPVLIPATKERGTTFWAKLIDWGNRINSHQHNSVDSSPVSLSSIVTSGVNYAIDATLTLSADQLYTFTLPAPATGFDARKSVIQLRHGTTFEELGFNPKPTSATTITIQPEIALVAYPVRLVVIGSLA